MSFIESILPFVRHGNELTLRLAPAEGGVAVQIVPHLSKMQADTTDEALAVLQAALTRPVLLTVPAETADADLTAVLLNMARAREPVADQHRSYLTEMEEAAAAARAAAAKKTDKSKATPAKTEAAKPAPAGTTTSAPAATPTASTAPPPAEPPSVATSATPTAAADAGEPGSALNLFDFAGTAA